MFKGLQIKVGVGRFIWEGAKSETRDNSDDVNQTVLNACSPS